MSKIKFTEEQQSQLERLHFLENKIRRRGKFADKEGVKNKDGGLTDDEYNEYEELQEQIGKFISL